ncbi:nicotinate-nucleotide--dimethylbenzimidazole phosphoribosyltransferase [Parahaliea sp. F7430]|uniref:Nicotinate-nucleotide--dimethylbenzimidazole phosphoribosyltransferase n=1 Tax=Sediminihaliea albiluteola TaxID=2758564 RepID=A0A7W2TVD1_9GAMM|nr:nicotinate-nucleotide--dimethylbenzimidazole phosphoribosyltransferase [Sediminihaliea albiluteola]MBA6412644.1 nicotinate-nucleotide--dimethylbenzimidazole phosphoribosyltransferase [Sediminihaliea albiluteola]
MNWYHQACPAPSAVHRQLAQQRQTELTKPLGSLGRLEEIAVDFAGWQATALPELSRIAVRVFAADHGISRRGVSAYPPEVTTQMIANFANGGAAINVLSAAQQADFAVVNMGTFSAAVASPKVYNLQLAAGSADLSSAPALSPELVEACLAAGQAQVDGLDCQLFVAGEMGIGNTTAAAAIYAAHLGLQGIDVTGRGTGIDDASLAKKIALIDQALALHADQLDSALGILRCLGGLEIAAICGAYIRCGQRAIPVLIDGFIASAAALLAVDINPSLRPWLMASHRSSEAAHELGLRALQLQPLLDLGLRLGEGSGAMVATPLLQSALQLHSQMATFAQAAISENT